MKLAIVTNDGRILTVDVDDIEEWDLRKPMPCGVVGDEIMNTIEREQEKGE